MMVQYQPGGQDEIAILFKQLQHQPVAANAEQALITLRRWERHRERAKVLGLFELDPRVRHAVLNTIMQQVRTQAPEDAQLQLRLNMMALTWDTEPSQVTVETCFRLFKGLAVSMQRAGPSPKDPKLKKVASERADPAVQVSGLVAPGVTAKPKGPPPAKDPPPTGNATAVEPKWGSPGGGQGRRKRGQGRQRWG